MKGIYAIIFVSSLFLTSCESCGNPPATESYRQDAIDSMPADNTSVADTANGNANVGMGGGN